MESKDIDAFLKEGLGLNWAARAFAKAQKLGVGKLTHTIKLSAGEPTNEAPVVSHERLCHTINLPEPMTFEHIIDGKEHVHPAVGMQEAHTYVCTWEGDTLALYSPDGSVFDLRRSLRKDGKMVCELRFPKKGDVWMTRLFERI